MVLVPVGEFLMGTDTDMDNVDKLEDGITVSETPQHNVLFGFILYL